MKPIPPPAGVGAASGRRILYVEDEDDNWQVTELRLRNRYSLVRAASDEEACRIVGSLRGDLYAVLMDIQLKGSRLDGIQLCRLFKGLLPDGDLPDYARACPRISAPIFFVTAHGSRHGEDEIRRAGGHALIHKPVDFIRLTLALAQVSAINAAKVLQG
jgi:CheY-like chemotaxis protein